MIPPHPSASSIKAPLNAPPTHARQVVLGFAVALAVITYIDRSCISQALPAIRADLKLDETQAGLIMSAFVFAYSAFEIPSGWLGDRTGPRGILMKVVVLWSLFTALTGAAWNYVSMLVCRFLFGVGEAGCFPNITKIFTIWLPTSERERAQGLLWFSARWGGAFTPLLVVQVMKFAGWRGTFVVFGLVGIVWAVAFYSWFRDRPADHPSVNAAELALMDGANKNAPSHEAVPWGRMFGRATPWLLMLQYFCMGYGWWFYTTWLPTYLQQGRGVTIEHSAFLSGLPLFFGGVGCLAGGWLSRIISRNWTSVDASRRIVSCFGFAGASVALVASTRIQDATLAMIVMGLASFSNDLAIANAWAACMDVGGRISGSLSGCMNMMGNGGGVVSPIVVAHVLTLSKVTADSQPTLAGWNSAILIGAAVYAVGALAWLFIDSVTPITEAEEFRAVRVV